MKLVVLVLIGVFAVAAMLDRWRGVKSALAALGLLVGLLLSPVLLLLLANAIYWWIGLTLIGVAVVLVYRRADWVAFALAAGMIATLIFLFVKADAFKGWNWVAPIRGEVVEARTGGPVPDAQVWMTATREFVGFIPCDLAGGSFYGPHFALRHAQSDQAGQFRLEKYLGVNPITQAEFLVYRQGYKAEGITLTASGGVSVLMQTQSWLFLAPAGPTVEFERKFERTRLRVELKRLGVWNSWGWMAHLRILDTWRSKTHETVSAGNRYGWPETSPLDEVFLNEASHYASQGGEISENLVRLFVDSLPGRGRSRSADQRVTAVELAVGEYCRQRPHSAQCSRGGNLVQAWIGWLEKQADEGSGAGEAQ